MDFSFIGYMLYFTHCVLIWSQQLYLLYRPFEKGVQNGFFNKKPTLKMGPANKCKNTRDLTNCVCKLFVCIVSVSIQSTIDIEKTQTVWS